MSVSIPIITIAKALADPTRLSVLQCVTSSGATSSQIARRLGVTRGTVTHHLGVLEDGGLITGTWDRGKHVFHRSAAELYFVWSQFGPPIVPAAPSEAGGPS